MADFMQAIRWMVDGFRVRRKNWIPFQYVYKNDNGDIRDCTETVIPAMNTMNALAADNWEIYEGDSWNLSDRLNQDDNTFDDLDVKYFIDEVKKLVIDGNYYGDSSLTKLMEKIDKLSGKRFAILGQGDGGSE